jgi:hypothetical protein
MLSIMLISYIVVFVAPLLRSIYFTLLGAFFAVAVAVEFAVLVF